MDTEWTPGDGSTPRPPGDSYWAVPGKVLAGPYPGDPTTTGARAKLNALLDEGVACFVDLTEEGEGPPLKPYAELLEELAADRGTPARHMRLPIRDVDVPTVARMREILDRSETRWPRTRPSTCTAGVASAEPARRRLPPCREWTAAG